MFIKNVTVTNPRNVLVQIPGFIVANWNLQQNEFLDVYYDEELEVIIIGKAKDLQRGGQAT